MNGEPCTIDLAPLGWRCVEPCDGIWFMTLRFFAARYPPENDALAHALNEHGNTQPTIRRVA